jgi:protein-S-isoprenylcysteine O-methyltransferase Ste14
MSEGRIAAASVSLFALQLAGRAAVMWPWNAAHFAAAAWRPIAAAFALNGWTLWHNRPGNFSVLPEPRSGARLITTGPYAHVRHPLYVGLMLFAAGCAIGWNTPLHWLAAAALVVVLGAKARREERLLRARFPDYAQYAARTPRFVPRIGRFTRDSDDAR